MLKAAYCEEKKIELVTTKRQLEVEKHDGFFFFFFLQVKESNEVMNLLSRMHSFPPALFCFLDSTFAVCSIVSPCNDVLILCFS